MGLRPNSTSSVPTDRRGVEAHVSGRILLSVDQLYFHRDSIIPLGQYPNSTSGVLTDYRGLVETRVCGRIIYRLTLFPPGQHNSMGFCPTST